MHIQHRCGMIGRYKIFDSQWLLIEGIVSPIQGQAQESRQTNAEWPLLGSLLWR